MKLLICIILLLPIGLAAQAQTYGDSILKYREQYVKDLLAEPRAPVKPSKIKKLRFYNPDRNYCVVATFAPSPGSKPFLIQTHSGKQKPFKEYGTLTFLLQGKPYTLHMYQMMDLVNTAAHKDDLFLPFNDLTNYETTFGGGRYIDLTTGDIKDGKVLLDFNKCYNPYCAYADGFSCPIPPDENRLQVEIPAGEKLFEK